MANNRNDYQAEYKRENYDRIIFLVRKGGKERLKIESAVRGYNSPSALFRDALKIAFDIEV